jgi:hypothetical protein
MNDGWVVMKSLQILCDSTSLYGILVWSACLSRVVVIDARKPGA